MAEKLDGWLANEKSCAILMKVKKWYDKWNTIGMEKQEGDIV